MKVVLELLGDAGRVLSSVEGLNDFRPESRERVRELLTQLKLEAERVLECDEEGASESSEREDFVQRSLEAISMRHYEEARKVLEEAVSVFPEDFEFLNYLGLVAWEEEDLQGAATAYHCAQEAVFGDQLDPKKVQGGEDPALRAVEGRALCLYRMGELEEALKLFRWLGENFPDEYVGCLYLAGEVHHLRGEVREAIDCYRRVPVEPAVLYNLGLAHMEDHDLERAVFTLIRAFVANVHVVSFLLGRYAYRKPCTPGYLGSESYAEEFVNACRRLWHREPGSLAILEACFDHGLVRNHLQNCSEQGGTGLLSIGDGTMECDGWLEALQDDASLQQMTRQVLERVRL